VPIRSKVVGPNLQVLEGLAAQVMTEMAKVQGVADLESSTLLGQPNLSTSRSIATRPRATPQPGRRQYGGSGGACGTTATTVR